MPTEKNIKVAQGQTVDLFAASGVAKGKATVLTLVSDLPIMIFVGATKPTDDAGFIPLSKSGDMIPFLSSIKGLWVKCPYGAEINFSENFLADSNSDGGSGGGAIPSGGTIGVGDDPRTKSQGRYYVTGKFVGAPTLAGGDYVGVMDVIKDYDGNNNGDIIKYFTKEGFHYLLRYAGGWESKWNTPNGELASQAITHVALTGSNLIFTHGDGAKHSIALPQPVPTGLQNEIQKAEQKLTQQGVDITALKSQVGEISHNIDGLTGVYSWRGITAPTDYPSEPKNAYFVNIHNTAGALTVSIPVTSYPLNDGTVFFLNNENSANQVTLTPPSGQSLDNATSAIVQPQQFSMFVKHGYNWVKTASGYIPISIDDLKHRVAASLNGQLHTESQINQMINNWFANPSNHALIDKILTGYGYSHSGSAPRPETVIVHIGVGQDYPSDFSSEIGHYATTQSLIVNHLDQNPSKVWIAVPAARSSKVMGITADGGMLAQWDSKDITVIGELWTVFISPTVLNNQHIEFKIKWGV